MKSTIATLLGHGGYGMAWKIFAVFGIAFGVIGTIGSIHSVIANVPDLIGLLLFPPSALGVYGYAFNKPIFTPKLWRPFAWIFGVWSIVSVFIAIGRCIPLFNDAKSIWVISGLATGIVLGGLLSYFNWLALWRYAKVVFPYAR